MNAHYRSQGNNTVEAMTFETIAWAEEFIDAKIPASLIGVLYKNARNAKKDDFSPSVKNLLDQWQIWKQRHLPEYLPSFAVESGKRTVEQEQRAMWGETLDEMAKRLTSPNPAPSPKALQMAREQQRKALAAPAPVDGVHSLAETIGRRALNGLTQTVQRSEGLASIGNIAPKAKTGIPNRKGRDVIAEMRQKSLNDPRLSAEDRDQILHPEKYLIDNDPTREIAEGEVTEEVTFDVDEGLPDEEIDRALAEESALRYGQM